MTDSETYENNLKHFQIIRRSRDRAQCKCPAHPDKQALAHITGEHEYFSIEDMMEITGESREEVLKQVEDMRAAALAAGENPDDYAVPVERKILYFPDGFTS